MNHPSEDPETARLLAEYRYKRARLPYRTETLTTIVPPIMTGLGAIGLILSGQPWPASAAVMVLAAAWGIGWGARSRHSNDIRELLRALQKVVTVRRLTRPESDTPQAPEA